MYRYQLAAFTFTLLGLVAAALADSPPTIVHNATIYTVNPAQRTAAALAYTPAGEIIRVGDFDALSQRYPDARKLDAGGATIVPGLIDAHGHVMGMGQALMRVDLVGTTSKQDALARMQAFAANLPQGQWLLGRGWDQNDWPVQQFPNAADLDQAFPERPVWLRRIDGHAGWANSAALAEADRDLSGSWQPEGGEIIRDANGRATGVLVDRAMELVEAQVPTPAADQQREALRRAMDHIVSVGLTGVHDAGTSLDDWQLMRDTRRRGELKHRIYAMADGDNPMLARLCDDGLQVDPSGWLTMRAVKLYADGALGSRGAALLADYHDQPGQRGLLIQPAETLNRLAKVAIGCGLQVNVHAIGDRGNRVVLDALAAAEQRDNPGRHRVEHAQVIALSDLPRFKQLGLIASMQPTHATSDMYWAEARVGPERIAGAYAWQRLNDLGVPLALGSDFPVEKADPLLGFYAAITRQDDKAWPTGGWLPDQRLSREQTLYGFTQGAAYAAFQEDLVGSLEVGKRADFVLLSKDIMRVAPAEILTTEVLATYVDGKEVFRAADPTTTLHTLFEQFFERGLEMNPVRASAIGDYRFNDQYANSIGPEHRAAKQAMDEEFLTRLKAIDRGQLSRQDQLSYDMFKLNRERALEGHRFPGHLQPINQFYSPFNSFVQLGSGTSVHPFKTVKHYDDWLSRIDDFVIYADQTIANMRQGIEQGVVQPRILMAKAVAQIDSQLVDNAQQSGFWAPIAEMPDAIGTAERERLTAAFETSIETKVLPAYRRVAKFVREQYLPATRDSVGLYALPDGPAWYAYNVRRITTTALSPEQIHQIGLDEVRRIHAQMHAVMAEVGFEGDLKAFFAFMNDDERFYFDQPEQLIQGYRDMSEHVAARAKALFDVSPKSGFEVRRVEPFREASASGGSYRTGTPDGSRPGVFYANAYDIKARPIWAMESLFLHEAIPGHHFQRSLQVENEQLPNFRRFGSYTAFTEGWGLYAESLGKEMGVYTDPYQYFGALNAELWRAIRLVVDTGIHAKRWSRQQVLDYMYANSAVKEARAVSEAERFMAIPGQALAYKIGELKIRQLRSDAEARLGDQFDVKDFHTQVLMDGPMPLSMLEAKINDWVQSQL